ncbi:MAG: sugar transferase [Fidelibacterota bacterium]
MSRIVHLLKIRFPVWAFSWFILAGDVVAGFGAFYFILSPRTDHPVLLFVAIQFLWSVIFFLSNLYQGEFRVSRIHEIKLYLQLTFIIMVSIIFLEALEFVVLPVTPREIFKYWLLFMMAGIPIRLTIRGYQKYLLRNGIGRDRTLIVGYNERGHRAAHALRQHDQQGYDVIGFVRAEDDEPYDNGSFPLLGEEDDIQEIIMKHQISDVVLALSQPEHTRIMTAVARINGAPVSIKVLPDLYEVITGLARTQQIAGLPMMDLDLNLHTIYVRFLKRLLDLAIGIPLFIVLLPVMGLIAILIRLDSPGPVLYRQERLGLHGKPFTINKFRSMRQDAESETGPVWAHENDHRITPLGRWLRRFRLDEIPQIFNVLKGDMSIVGPRPERPYFVDQLMKTFPFYHRRLNVKPGISGWAQIKHPYDQDIEDVRQKLKYDFYYIENISFGLDVKIIFSTFWVMVSGQGR